jgi:carbohydrate-binding DOMON domain-containing protein
VIKVSITRRNRFIFALCLSALAWIFLLPRAAYADGGSFPTSTPTQTITPSITPTPTVTATFPIVPTATVTPIPLQPDLQALPLQPTPTPPPARPNFGIVCAPLAVAVILAIIIFASWWYRRRTV